MSRGEFVKVFDAEVIAELRSKHAEVVAEIRQYNGEAYVPDARAAQDILAIIQRHLPVLCNAAEFGLRIRALADGTWQTSAIRDAIEQVDRDMRQAAEGRAGR